ncbi:MAG: hypothetical protein LBR50_09455, partial [Tannerella sp.]|nr:hypothetical protein [Tannerella sp.]
MSKNANKKDRHPSATTKTATGGGVKPSSAKPFPFLILGLGFAVLQFLLSSPVVNRGWGLNAISFWETPIIIAYYAVLIAILPPPPPLCNNLIIRILNGFSGKNIILFVRKWKYPIFVLFAIAGGFLFHALQVKYVFLGDCGVRPTEIEKGDVYYPTEF